MPFVFSTPIAGVSKVSADWRSVVLNRDGSVTIMAVVTDSAGNATPDSWVVSPAPDLSTLVALIEAQFAARYGAGTSQ